MYDLKATSRIETYLEILKERQFKKLLTISKFKKAVCPNFEYYRLPKEGLNFKSVQTPDFYGEDNVDVWYQVEIEVPNKENIFFNLDLQTDSLVIINDNEKFYAINPFHSLVPLDTYKGKTIKISICIWSGYNFPGYHPKESNRVLVTVAKRVKQYPLIFKSATIVEKNVNSYNLYYDVYVLYEQSKTLDTNSLLYQKIISTLHKSLMKIQITSTNLEVQEREAKDVRDSISTLLKYKNGTLSARIYSIGSAHLDYAWLWPIKETIRKAARTLSEMNFLMDIDLNFKFMFSQPILIEQVKEIYPEIFKDLLINYNKGQFEPNGVGLVEPDCMLSSGEGLIRNILYSKKITNKLFNNYLGDTFYVPDSFGYMATLPQILVKSGIKYIVTSKLGWNDTTRHPLDLFNWKGIDGSVIKAHMIQGAYEGTGEPTENVKMWDNISNKDLQTSLFRPIGEGDGGGGTRLEDLELIKRQEDLQGLPKNTWSTMSDAMSEIFSEEVPLYDGELYLELHRGTYTTQARTKKYHRQIDKKLHNIEYLISYFYIKNKISKEEVELYKEKLDACWRIFLINQFHDILPGSSVRCVNEEAHKSYEEAITILNEIQSNLVQDGKYILNLSPFKQDNINPYETKIREERKYSRAKVGLQKFKWGSVTLSSKGEITSFVVNGRELVKGKLNFLEYGEDYPNNWDAWDIELDNLSNLRVLDTEYKNGIITSKGDNGSIIEQEIIIYEDIAKIDFKTKVNWVENHRILRAKFNHNINSSFTDCDIPFGYFKRSNSNNLNHERAKFEVPSHNYISQKDEELSIALITDCKYGYAFKNNQLSVSLLRSPKAPDEAADIGEHEFTYSIFVTKDGISSVMSEAEYSNNKPISCDKEIINDLVAVKSENIVLETLKIAEDKNSLIFRFRETLGILTEGEIEFNNKLFNLDSIQFVNLVEEEINDTFNFSPFEIKTIRINKI
jgi:alpha-mannosidase